MINKKWYQVDDEQLLMTPGLLVYPECVQENIQSMLKIAGGIERLWPHVKTHKMSQIVKLQMNQGIKRFKCATLSEVKMLVDCQVDQILLAIQPTKEKMIRFLEFQKANPSIQFSTLVDNLDSLEMFSSVAKTFQQNASLWLDINNGMNRTGIVPTKAAELFIEFQKYSHLNFEGIHVYDGHIRPPNLSERIDLCNEDFKAVETLINQIEEYGGVVSQIIAGGSPSFFPHSLRNRVFLSPGTTLLWDLGYKKIWHESPFLNAAVLITRLISKPQKNIFCFDLGHKSVASEMPLPRVEIFGLEKAKHLGQSEEHLMVKFDESNSFKVGDLFYALPYHICPTVAKYNKVYTVIDGVVGPLWDVEARAYQL